jgi:type I restriction enzyme M protein
MRNQYYKKIVKAIDDFRYVNDYSKVFDDLLNIGIHLFDLNPGKKLQLTGYTKEQEEALSQMFRDLVMCYNEEITEDGMWADPLGRLYEEINSKYKAKGLGQFFTPETVVEAIVKINVPKEVESKTIHDPASGSGRMLIASHAHNPRNTHYAIDIDPYCFKMTTLNMCIHGCVGEVAWGDTLRYKFNKVYKINPGLKLYGRPGIMEIPLEYSYIQTSKPKVIEPQENNQKGIKQLPAKPDQTEMEQFTLFTI